MPTLQTINLGQYANDGTGDDIRTAFEKVNTNFNTLNLTLGVTNATNVGSGAQFFKTKIADTLQFRTLTSTNNSVTVTSLADTVNLAVTTELSTDLSPVLGGDLDLNKKIIFNGDAQTTVFGYSVPITSGLLELILASGSYDIDFGTMNDPTGGGNDGTVLDLGDLTYDEFANGIDFGTISVPSGSGSSGGSGGSNLPGDGIGYLKNDGNGTLTWDPIAVDLATTVAVASGTITLNFTYGWTKVILTESVISIIFTNIPPAGTAASMVVEFVQDSTGGRTVSGTSFLTAGGIGLDLSLGIGATTLVSFVTSDGGTKIFGLNAGKNWI